jgi:superfamily II DNA or RNA helicase
MMQLRDYQQDTLEKILLPPPDITRQLVVIATGGGKTVVFGAAIKDMIKPGQRALVLAHRTNLLEQAAEKIRVLDPTLVVEFEQASRKATRSFGMLDSVSLSSTRLTTRRLTTTAAS